MVIVDTYLQYLGILVRYVLQVSFEEINLFSSSKKYINSTFYPSCTMNSVSRIRKWESELESNN